MASEQTRSTRRAKPVYKTTDGELVPGVTTILGLRAKPALVPWAFNLGKKFPELSSPNDYTDDLARIGSCAHEILSAHLRGGVANLDDFTKNEIEAASVPVNRYFDWTRGKVVELIAADKAMVSDLYRFGGTLDVYMKIDGRYAVVDFKTGKAIYLEHMIQTSAYAELLQERDERVDEIRVLQIGRTGSEGFTERVLTSWQPYWMAFLALRSLHDIEKAIERGEDHFQPSFAAVSRA